MSGYCPDCGNQICICDEIEQYKKELGMKKSFEKMWLLKIISGVIIFFVTLYGGAYIISSYDAGVWWRIPFSLTVAIFIGCSIALIVFGCFEKG